MRVARAILPLFVIAVACGIAPPLGLTDRAEPFRVAAAVEATDSVRVGDTLTKRSAVRERWSTTTPALIAVAPSADGKAATVTGLAAGSAQLRTAHDTIIYVRTGNSWKLKPRLDSVVNVATIRVVAAAAPTPPPADTASTPADTTTAPDTGAAPIPQGTPASGPAALPELPRVTPSAAMPTVTRSVRVAAGADLQAAINAAAPGTEIILDAGATFVGPFYLPPKSGDGWIVIRSSGTMPAPGTRVTPASAPQMARILATGTAYGLTTQLGARRYRLVGLEITADPSVRETYSLVNLGDHSAENTEAAEPSQLVLDRVYIHGSPTLDFQRCVLLNAGETAIVDSWLSECHGSWQDSQAIMGWNGTGPYLIENNYLEGAGENVMFGGADPAIPGRLPRDITIRRNHFFKPRAWEGVWATKNSFELKLGQRILVEGNVFENSFGALQDGTLIVLKTVNQGGSATWSETSDVTFRYNILKGGKNGMGLSGLPGALPGAGVPMNKVLIAHNIVTEIADRSWVFGNGWAVRLGGVRDLTFDHNTFYGNELAIGMEGTDFYGSPRLTITNNVIRGGVVSTDGQGWWDTAAPYHAPGAVLAGNLLVLPWYQNANHAPTLNTFATDLAEVLLDVASPEWRLKPGPFTGRGADVDAVLRLTAGVVR